MVRIAYRYSPTALYGPTLGTYTVQYTNECGQSRTIYTFRTFADNRSNHRLWGDSPPTRSIQQQRKNRKPNIEIEISPRTLRAILWNWVELSTFNDSCKSSPEIGPLPELWSAWIGYTSIKSQEPYLISKRLKQWALCRLTFSVTSDCYEPASDQNTNQLFSQLALISSCLRCSIHCLTQIWHKLRRRSLW